MREALSLFSARGGKAELAGLLVELLGAARVARHAVALRVGGGELVAALTVARLAGPVVVLGGLRGIRGHAGAARIHAPRVEAAEGVAPLAAELRELTTPREVYLDSATRQIQTPEQRAGPRPVRRRGDGLLVGLAG